VQKFDMQGAVFLSGAQPYMWYVEVLVKTVPRRKCPWGATKEIGLFTTPPEVTKGDSFFNSRFYQFLYLSG